MYVWDKHYVTKAVNEQRENTINYTGFEENKKNWLVGFEIAFSLDSTEKWHQRVDTKKWSCELRWDFILLFVYVCVTDINWLVSVYVSCFRWDFSFSLPFFFGAWCRQSDQLFFRKDDVYQVLFSGNYLLADNFYGNQLAMVWVSDFFSRDESLWRR